MQIIANIFDQVDEAIVEAKLGNITWNEALMICSNTVGADAMTLEADSESHPKVKSLGSVGFSEQIVADYVDHYHFINPRIEKRRNIKQTTILFDDEISSDDWKFKGGAFRHWLRTARAPMSAASVVIPRADSSRLVLAVHRDTISRSNTEVETFLNGFNMKIRMLDMMVGLNKSSHLKGELKHQLTSSMQEITIELDQNLLLVDSSSEPYARLQPLAIIDDQSGYQTQLRFAAKNENDAFERAIMAAVAHLPAKFRIQNDYLRGTVSIAVSKDSVGNGGFVMKFCYVICGSSKADIIRSAFGLTKRQSQIVGLIVDGVSLTEAAKRMAISVNTGRVFMTQVFDRLGVRRRIDLIRKVDNLLQG